MGFQQVSLVNLLRKPIETPLKLSFRKKSKIFKMIFLHDKIIFSIQFFFYDLEFLYTFDLSHSRRSRGRTEKMGTKVTQIFLYLQNIIDIETQLQKSSVQESVFFRFLNNAKSIQIHKLYINYLFGRRRAEKFKENQQNVF